MKKLFILLSLICLYSYGQEKESFNLKRFKTLTLPYSTDQFANRSFYENRYFLHGKDSSFIMNQLLTIPHSILNRYGGTGFGDMDYPDSVSLNIQMEDVTKIAVLGILKTGDCYLVHMELERSFLSFGILALMSAKGEIYNWAFSNGSANGGNPHGNLTRDFTITAKKRIIFKEYSWGDNTENYNFSGSFVVNKSDDGSGGYQFTVKHISFTDNGYGD